MANNLYLSRFRARNFRSFGEVDIELPAEPGLVVLEGPNGLGKTSWLEALEWVLSGQVHRWRQQDQDHEFNTVDHIARRGTSRAPCNVEIEFGELTAGWSGGLAPPPATWLCDDPARWSLRADNINGFLRGTHILPQSSSLRLLHLGAEERWNQVLRVVSGYSEIDDLSAALQGSKGPLTTALRERQSRLAEAKVAQEAWHARVVAVLDRRAQAETTADLLAPSRAAATLLAADVPTFTTVDSDAGARELIAHLQTQLATRRSDHVQLEERRISFASLAVVPARWQAVQNAADLATEAVLAREAEELRLRERLAQLQADEHTATQRCLEAEGLTAASLRRTEALVLLAETEAAIPGSRDTLAAARERASNAVASLAEAVVRRDDARRHAELRYAYEAQVEACRGRLDAHEGTTAAWRRVVELFPRREAVTRAGERLKAMMIGALAALQAARATLAERAADAARALKVAESVRATASEVQGLVASLARHVNDHTIECPLCLASYPGFGELRKQVEQAKERQGPVVIQSEDALREAGAREAIAASVVQDAEVAYTKAEGAYAENQGELSTIEGEISELRARLTGIAVGHEESELVAVRVAIEAERTDLATLPGAELESGPVLAMRLQQAEDELRVVETGRVAAVASAEVVATTLAQLEARGAGLRQHLDVAADADLDGLVVNARASQGRVDEALRMEREAKATVHVARQQEEASLTAATNAAVAARIARDQKRAEQQEIARAWTLHELGLPPSNEHLAEAANALAVRLDAVNARIASIVAAVEGVGRWLVHAAVDREARELDVAAAGTGSEAWEKHALRLQERVDATDLAHRRAETVRADIEIMANSAEKTRASMRSELQARLGPILAPMLRSLIVDPTIAEAVIALAEERKKTKVRATVGREATDLLALASEGQLSGVNLAVQLSMALAFRWCRWPAVLLDDPAQYSDVVHSTNLVETLRLLSFHHGFQVFLATHDRDFALYVERKFRNDGLPATRVMFRQPSDPTRGVVPRVASRLGEAP